MTPPTSSDPLASLRDALDSYDFFMRGLLFGQDRLAAAHRRELAKVRAALSPDPAAPQPGARLMAAVRRVIADGIDSPGTYDELHNAFYEARDLAPQPEAGSLDICVCPQSWIDRNTSHHPACQWWRDHGRIFVAPQPEAGSLRDAAQAVCDAYFAYRGIESPLLGERQMLALRAALEATDGDARLYAPCVEVCRMEGHPGHAAPEETR